MIFNGKSTYKNKICIDRANRKYSIIFIFDNKEEARDYYEDFSYENEKLISTRIKIFFCKHKKQYDLNVDSNTHHYNYCPDCNRALFVNDETEEQREERLKILTNLMRQEDIKEMERDIRSTEYSLNKKKEQLEKMKRKIE